MQESQPIVEVVLPHAAQEAVRARDLDAALAAQAFPEEKRGGMRDVASYVARLSPAQRQMLLDALSHSLGDTHGAGVSFAKSPVGYELGDIQLSVTDSTVTEEGKVAPIAIIFAYKR